MAHLFDSVPERAVYTGIAIAAGAAGYLLSQLTSSNSNTSATQPTAPRAGAASAGAAAAAKESVATRSTTSSGGGGPEAYETRKAVDEYLHFHFGDEKDQMPYAFGPKSALRFTERVAKLGQPFLTRESGRERLRALDVGCAVGGASFELATWCDEVVGLDFSHAFVRYADAIKESGELTYSMVEEGEITVERVARRPNVDISKVTFVQGDACNLSHELGTFDLVLAVNLLCRLPEPHKFLERLASLVRPGGLVVLVSPHSWLPGWTPKEKWVGGYVDAQGPHRTGDGVAAVLSKDFSQLYMEDVPFLIREHARKFQFGVSFASVWRRKSY